MPETETKDGFAVRVKTPGDYMTNGYEVDDDFETITEASKWIGDVVQQTDGVWLSLASGGWIDITTGVVIEPYPAKIEREVALPPPRRRRGIQSAAPGADPEPEPAPERAPDPEPAAA